MADLATAVHKAVFAALAGITVTSEAGGTAAVAVYDHAPADAPYPYIVLSGQALADDSPLDGTLGLHSLYLGVWSQYRGQKQVLEMLHAIRNRLAGGLVLDAGEAALVRIVNQQSSRDADGITYQGSVTVQVTAGE